MPPKRYSQRGRGLGKKAKKILKASALAIGTVAAALLAAKALKPGMRAPPRRNVYPPRDALPKPFGTRTGTVRPPRPPAKQAPKSAFIPKQEPLPPDVFKVPSEPSGKIFLF